jgi:SulP family sulfate permease
MPALAGLLIIVGFRTLKPERVGMVWRTGAVQQAVMTLTFLAALFIPLQYAVLLGVALAVVLYVFQQSNKVTVKAWAIGPGQYPVEKDPPPVVPAGQVTILMPYGSLFYAAAPVFGAQLPEVTDATRHAAVILVLRGQAEVGSTFLNVLARYAEQLSGQESKLMLAGVEPHILNPMERTGILQAIGWENVFTASDGVGEALLRAVDAAERWVTAQREKDAD